MTINLATVPRRLADRLGTGWQPVQYTVFGDNHALTARIQGPRPGFQSLILDTAIHRDGTGTHRLRLELPHDQRTHTDRRTRPHELKAPLTTTLARLATLAHRELLTPDPDTHHHTDHSAGAGYAPHQTPTSATEYAQKLSDRLDAETIGTIVLAHPDPTTGVFTIDIDTADWVYDRTNNAWAPCTRFHLALAHGPATDAVAAALAAHATLTTRPGPAAPQR
ncbi:hypothetical protein [Nocardia yamanashiensis]|uniref:hypothetical protein n=1 Tax=Nocardia yamanashiensis TaxID=209247 RepID=UPI000834D898|nr:hypothetical protein [Nocardia yamanashiensis]